MRAPSCDEVDCGAESVWMLRAQWTWADFGEWYACDEHLETVTEYLLARTVDGNPLLELATVAIDGQD